MYRPGSAFAQIAAASAKAGDLVPDYTPLLGTSVRLSAVGDTGEVL